MIARETIGDGIHMTGDWDDTARFNTTYLTMVHQMLRRILDEEREAMARAAERMADQIAADRLVYVYGPGGHSNVASQEVFFRAGGLAHISAILDEGTLLSNGALRATAMERTPGYGRTVIATQQLAEGDLIILVSAYGVNAALIDAAMEARARRAVVIGLNSHGHAVSCAPDHPARHPSKQNLHDIVDIAIDTKIPVGDALVEIPHVDQPIGAASTFANIFALHCLVMQTVAVLAKRGVAPPIWRSVNAPGGDATNANLISRMRGRIRWL
jgi:uncharacterized phosphosugar-binding protein